MAAQKDKPPQVFVDTLHSFEGGVDTYPPPLLLKKNQLSSALNTTVRKDYVTQRSVLRQIALDPTSLALLNSAFAQGVYQGGVYFEPDSGAEGIATAIGGRLISIFPNIDQRTAAATEIVLAWISGHAYVVGDVSSFVVAGATRYYGCIVNVTSATNPSLDAVHWKLIVNTGQNWLWQAELWVIWNDGLNNPIFYNTNAGTVSQSNNGTTIQYATQVTTGFTLMASTTITTGVKVTSTANMQPGTNLILGGSLGVVTVVNVVDLVTIDVRNVSVKLSVFSDTAFIVAGTLVQWSSLAFNQQLPPGRMGTYGMGRNWFSLVDGRQFVASDQVGGSSGTLAFNFRDAILNITENIYLAGGGNFLVPGPGEEIQSFDFATTLDQSLGQGPLQVFTKNLTFSCQTPADRLTWQDITNPILTVSDNNGCIGANNVTPVNGDLTFRSIDGIRSLILARRDIDVWGNVPISREVQALLDADNETLLNWGSAIVFDNRLLQTATPVQLTQGVVHKAIIPLNVDPLSSLRGKQPSVYDAEKWQALNVFQLFVGQFESLTRAFALCWNAITSSAELYEVLRTSDTTYLDNDVTRITWAFDTASLFKESGHIYKRLNDGEIHVDALQGTVDFQAWWKPDQYPCFTPWLSWQECQTQPKDANQPGFRPRMGLGTPPIGPCDPTNNRPLAEGYTFDLRFIITGKVRFLGGKFKAVETDEPEYAPPQCVQQCPST